MQANSPEHTTDSAPRRIPDGLPHGKEPFIKDRLTWRTLDLPPGAPPRKGLVGFLRFLVVAAR